MFLYNSHGYHIANFFNYSLYAVNGENIGRFIPQFNIFVDLNGGYLGEIIEDHYLVLRLNSSYLNVNLGIKTKLTNIVSLISPKYHKALSPLGLNKDVVIFD